MPNYKTPKKKKSGKHHANGGGGGSPTSRAITMSNRTKQKAVDLVTGKTTIEYFFDPSLVISGPNGPSTSETPGKAKDSAAFLGSKRLFMPCTIIKPLDNEENMGGGTITSTTSATSGARSSGKAVSANSCGSQQHEPYAGPTLVKTADGSLHKISDSTCLIALQAPDDYVGVDDVLHLPQISEASLTHCLRTRYRRDDIYTAAGPILISINPYKTVNAADGNQLYSEEQMLLYRSKTELGDDDKPPHLFQVADRAYTALMESVHVSASMEHLENEDAVLMREYHHEPGAIRNQSIIISGESGAGKTEATKIIMQFLARITRKTVHDSKAALQSPDGKLVAAALEDRVLSSNPLLETFGNAQTLRNDNSSRFGKFIHIFFNAASGSITGASISNYLLEKTRITTQVEGERNYHIFYQLLSNDSMCEEFGLQGGATAFHYLSHNDTTGGPAALERLEQDANDLTETIRCLSSIGLDVDQQAAVFGMAAAVLHLGNVEFVENGSDDEGGALLAPHSQASLARACQLLGLEPERVTEAILTKVLTVNGKVIKKQQSVAMAEDKRDAMAKMTYSCLFLWLVQRINETLSNTSAIAITTSSRSKGAAGQVGFIGVLDIYGFENFDFNGFEQLLINYCNEKLQRHFNRHLFEVEQELYANEGVDWSYITFNDNRPCLELIEGGGGVVGILNTLDDAWGSVGNACEKDSKFITHLHKLFGTVHSAESKKAGHDHEGGHKNFVTPKFGMDRLFIIVHYAGEVRYTVDGFVEKNMETLSNELREIGDQSTSDLPKHVYECGQGDVSAGQPMRSSIRGVSVGSQFRSSLQALVTDLDRTQPHYIRCIKPNANKAPSSFMAGEVLKQLRYSGMMEAIRIRREGYALREEHETFFNRFSVLLSSADLKGGEAGIEQLVKVLSKRLGVTEADWQIGHSKIFLRRELSDKLERLARLRVHVAARTIGRFARRVVHRRVSRVLVPWMRFRLYMLRKNRERDAVNKVAAAFRRYRQQEMYTVVRKAMIRLQSVQRQKLAVQRVLKIRDPYCDMSFRECKQMLRKHEERLEHAVKKKDFRAAAGLEAKIAEIKIAVEAKRPLTRAVIDAKIEQLQAKVDEAVQRKAYSECNPLQDELDELIRKRFTMPTIEDLRAAVREAEAVVTEAAKSRDFARAASGQTAIVEARKRLVDELAAEEDEEFSESKDEPTVNVLGYESRAQLERDIVDIAAQIKTAIGLKDFTKASSLQLSLDELERLRKAFPSIQEIEAELQQARAQMEEAVAKKQFNKAGLLDGTVTDLETKLAAERTKMSEYAPSEVSTVAKAVTPDGADVVFESRASLETAIKATAAAVAQAVTAKQFKGAETLQEYADALLLLRTFLPTYDELKSSIAKKTMEMNNAIAVKQFAHADGLNAEIEALQKKLSKEPAPTPPPAALRDTAIQTAVPKAKISAQVKTPSGKPPMHPSDSRTVSTAPRSVARQGASIVSGTTEQTCRKTVAKLRPAKPFVSHNDDSILTVCQMLASKRGHASIIVGVGGGLSGILTDTDVTRRVVAKNVVPSTTPVSEVMTANPTCVAIDSPAIDALNTMVESRFRHLPVVGDDGSIVGVLDIAKCLHDAIGRLERAQEKNSSAAENVVQQVIQQQGGKGAQAAALQALLGTLMNQAFGNQAAPTLASILEGKPCTAVAPDTTIRAAAMLMSEHRKAALVVEDGCLVGIFGFKDMMTRAVAKELDIDSVPVSVVMTPSPESVLPSTTVLEALQLMHDNKFLTLPVVGDDGTVIGLVDVMDVIYGCGGAEGWRSMFNAAMNVDGDTVSVSGTSFIGKSTIASVKTAPNPKNSKSVASLRPSKPIVSNADDSILAVVQVLRERRSAASILVDRSGCLAGILTDTDVTRRVVAKNVDPNETLVAEVMTPSPTCVSLDDPAMDALKTMLENHFRHLPVVDASGAVVGLLDIAKCLNDAMVKLERAQKRTQIIPNDALSQLIGQKSSDSSALALQALLGSLMAQNFGSQAAPTLASILANKPSTMVSPGATIRAAGMLMSEHRKAALIVDDGRLVGIFGFKDMMSRAVAKEVDIDTVTVSEVMTPNPDSVLPSTTVLEALQVMHDNKFLTLPVVDDDGTVVGLVDVMDVIYGCGGAEGWRSMFSAAMDVDDESVVSEHASRIDARKPKSNPATPFSMYLPGNIPATLEFEDHENLSLNGSTIGDERGVSKILSPDEFSGIMPNATVGTFKLSDWNGKTHRIRCEILIEDLIEQAAEKVGVSKRGLQLQFVDEEGDTLVVTTDDDVLEAWNIACKSGVKVAKLTAVALQPKLKVDTRTAAGVGAGIVAVIVCAALVLSKSRRS